MEVMLVRFRPSNSSVRVCSGRAGSITMIAGASRRSAEYVTS